MEESVLFLDDDHERCQAFLLRQTDATIVRCAADAIALLKSRCWSEVHLDHDLNGGTYEDPQEKNTGIEVVRYIVCDRPDVRTFVVHSHNERSGPVMVGALESAGYRVVYAPFRFMSSGYRHRAHDDVWASNITYNLDPYGDT